MTAMTFSLAFWNVTAKIVPMIIERMKKTNPGETICLSYEECEELLKLLELLKEQQPRVLKYEELFKEETFCLWYESKEHFPMMQVACIDGEYEDNEVFVAIDDAYENWMTYGRTWRMWSSRPTEEQRKAEPWKDGEQE